MKLNNLKLIICNGNYINDDAISNAINYIYRLNSNKNLPIYCYGIPNMTRVAYLIFWGKQSGKWISKFIVRQSGDTCRKRQNYMK